MKTFWLIAVVCVVRVASAQVGVQTVCLNGLDGTPEVACVGERVVCLSRFVNDSNDSIPELWSVTLLSVDVFHPSGAESSGNLLLVPQLVPAGSGQTSFAEAAFFFTTRLEDVPAIATHANATAKPVGQVGVFRGTFPGRVFVSICDEPTLLAHRTAYFARTRRAVCQTIDPFASVPTRVCRTVGETFTSPVE